MKKRVLFICPSKSVGSQLAETLLNHGGRPHFEAYSEVTDAKPPHPLGIRSTTAGIVWGAFF